MTPDTPELLPTMADALSEYLAEMDADDWCQRLKYGECSLRKCLVDADGKLRTPGSYDGATCARYRLELARHRIGSPREGETERLVERVALLEAALKLAENALMRLPGDTVLVSPTLLENLRAALTKAHGTL